MAEKTITVQLVKSSYGRQPNQAKTLKALGLTKRNSIVTLPVNDATLGQIATVKHLLKVIE